MQTYSIGRSNDNDIVIRDHSVSRHHAELRIAEDGKYQLVDLESTNGVYVQGDDEEWIQVYETFVSEGERIMIGGVASTVSELIGAPESGIDPSTTDAEPPPAEPPPPPPEHVPPAQAAPPPQPERGIDPGSLNAGPGGQDPANAPTSAELPASPEADTGPGARTYQEYLTDKQTLEGSVGEMPPPPSLVQTRPRRGRGWIKWAAIGGAVVLLAGAGTFAAIQFKDDIFGGETTATGSGSTKPVVVKKVPRANWSATFGGSKDDHAAAIHITASGGFIVAGHTTSTGKGGEDGWAVLIDKDGYKIREITYGGAQDDRIEALIRTNDGNYLAVGRTKSKGKGDWDFWVLRLDPTGAVLWETVVGGAKADIARGAVAIRDGGFVIAGHTRSKTKNGASRAWLVKLDAKGKRQWDVTAGRAAGNYEVRAVEQTAEGGFIIAGSHARPKRGSDIWLARVSTKRKVVWQFATRGRAVDYASAIFPSRRGTFLIAATSASRSARGGGRGDAYIFTLTAKGRRKSATAYGYRKLDSIDAMVRVSDGFILAGFTESKGAGGRDLWLVKINNSSRHEWDRTYGGTGLDNGIGVLAMKDGSIVVAGNTASRGAGGNDAWVLKLDKEGLLPGGGAGTGGGTAGGAGTKGADKKAEGGSTKKPGGTTARTKKKR